MDSYQIDNIASAIADGNLSLLEAHDYIKNKQNSTPTNVPVRINQIPNGDYDSHRIIYPATENECDFSSEIPDNECNPSSFNDYDDVVGASEYQQPSTSSVIDNSLSEKEFYMAMIGKFLFSDFSKRRVKKEIQMDILFGRSTIKSMEYENFLKDVESRYCIRIKYMCPQCFGVLPKVQKCVCLKELKRGKVSTIILISTGSIRQQLADVINTHFAIITSQFYISKWLIVALKLGFIHMIQVHYQNML